MVVLKELTAFLLNSYLIEQTNQEFKKIVHILFRRCRIILELVKEIYSPSKEYKVVIKKRLRDDLLEIDVYVWESEWETWMKKSSGFSLTDNIKSALEIAKEKLMVISGEVIE